MNKRKKIYKQEYKLAVQQEQRWELYGYCEFGYRLFRTETGIVERFPIPLTEVY